MLEFVEANHLWFSSQKQKGENEEREQDYFDLSNQFLVRVRAKG